MKGDKGFKAWLKEVKAKIKNSQTGV